MRNQSLYLVRESETKTKTNQHTKMENLDVTAMAKAEEAKQNKVDDSPEDLLEVAEDIRFMVNNMHYQSPEIRGKVYFISSEDLEELPKKIAKLIDEKVDNRQ